MQVLFKGMRGAGFRAIELSRTQENLGESGLSSTIQKSLSAEMSDFVATRHSLVSIRDEIVP